MAKLTLADLANLNNPTSAVVSINANNALIETALENTLSRDGTSPNAMNASLDMNGNLILNTPSLDGSVLGSTATDIVAGPDNTQGTATLLFAVFNTVTSVNVKGDAVKLPAALPGAICYVNSIAGNQATLYPPEGQRINTGSIDSPITLTPFTASMFICFVEGQWIRLVRVDYD